MSTDRRNRYRGVSRMDRDGDEMWTLQVRHWWWPFWRTLNRFCLTEERARERAKKHAKRHNYQPRVVDFGPLP